MNDLATRVIKAIVTGFVAGLITVLILLVISALVPGVHIDSGLWALVIGVLAGLWVFLTGNSVANV